MKLDKEHKTITLSQKTGITLTVGAVVALILGGYAAGQKMANLEARISGIEARAEWDAESAGTLTTKMEALQQGLNETNNNVTRLSTQIESLIQRSGTTVRVTPATSTHTVVIQSPPAEKEDTNPGNSNPPEQALANLLQGAPCRSLGLFCN